MEKAMFPTNISNCWSQYNTEQNHWISNPYNQSTSLPENTEKLPCPWPNAKYNLLHWNIWKSLSIYCIYCELFEPYHLRTLSLSLFRKKKWNTMFTNVLIQVNSLMFNLFCLTLVLLQINDMAFRLSPLQKQHKSRAVFFQIVSQDKDKHVLLI